MSALSPSTVRGGFCKGFTCPAAKLMLTSDMRSNHFWRRWVRSSASDVVKARRRCSTTSWTRVGDKRHAWRRGGTCSWSIVLS
eukprot:5091153-Amphidinium_carterae.1